MTLGIVFGILAAVIVALPQAFYQISNFWFIPSLVLGVACFGMVLQRFVLDRRPGSRNYDGLADLFLHVHSPASPDSAFRWVIRAVISFALTLFGGLAGPEGAAVEAVHALSIGIRSRSAKWFEHRRRTDASSALSAGIAAAFAAPFAAVLLPIELGIGGRTLTSVASALSGFLAIKFFASLGIYRGFEFSGAVTGAHGLGVSEWIAILVIGALAGAASALIIRFFRYNQDSLLDLFQTQTWMRTLAGGVLLFLVTVIYHQGHLGSSQLFEQVLWSRWPSGEVAILFSAKLLGLALVLAGFGTIGLFWPVFTLGAAFGSGVDHLVFHDLPGFSILAAWIGASAFFGGILGAPFTAAILCYEMTQNIQIILPAAAASLLAKEVRNLMKTSSLVEADLKARGLSLVEGRASSVLTGISVREAMIQDHETVLEHEPVNELYARLTKSKYPFLPVVNAQGTYRGMLTIDLVQEAWETQGSQGSLSRLLEAKDLVYRSKINPPTILGSSRLSETNGLFADVPCIPVLSDDKRVLGLLFVYNVRLAYEKEITRRSLLVENREE